MIKQLLAALSILLVLPSLMSAAGTEASPRLEAIQFARVSANEEKISFDFSSQPELTVFAIRGDSPRIVIDIPKAEYGGQNNVLFAEGMLASRVRLGRHDGTSPKIRAVVDLSKAEPVDYRYEMVNETVFTLYLRTMDELLEAHDNALDQEITATANKAAAGQKVPVYLDNHQAGGGLEKESSLGEKQILQEERGEKREAQKIVEAPETSATESVEVARVTEASATVEVGEVAEAVEEAAEPVEQVEPVEAAEVVEAEKMALAEDTPVAAAPKSKTEAEVPPADPVEPLQGAEMQKMISATPLLKEIRFEAGSGKKEKILFYLNDFHPPNVSAKSDDRPTVFADFAGMELADGIGENIAADGLLVDEITVIQDQNKDTIQVRVILVEDKDYDLRQVFFKNDNLFVLVVNELESLPQQESLKKP